MSRANRQRPRGRPPLPPARPAGAQQRLAAAVRDHAAGRLAEAERGYRALLAARPDHPDALRLLGLLLVQRRELADVIEGLGDAAAAEDRRGTDAYRRAVALVATGRYQAAETACREALAADGGHPPALVLLAQLLRGQGKLDEAVATARRALRAAPTWSAHRELGTALAAQDRVVEALPELAEAARLAPADAQVHLDLGNVVLSVGALAAARECFARAVALRPDSASLVNNLGLAELRMGNFREAARLLRRAEALAPDDLGIRYNRSFAVLGCGDLAQGWDLFEHGLATGGRGEGRQPGVPRWEGEAGRRVLVWREQGVGDELRLASCYPDALARAGEVVIACDPRLTGLLARSFPAAEVRPWPAAVTGDVDAHCPAGSLPRLFRTDLSAFPDRAAYLVADPDRRSRWRSRLAALGDRLTVGIAWRSMNLSVDRLHHYTTLAEWDPVLATPGVAFVNLQYGPPDAREAELVEVEERTGVRVHRWDDVDYTDDFEELAALTSCLDVVVGVGTTPAILAGALGRPALMLSLADPLALGTPHWPWMPTLRRFPRAWDEPWDAPMTAVAADLRARVARASGYS